MFPELATFLLLVLVQVAPPGIGIFKPHSEYKSLEDCVKAAQQLPQHQRPACVPLPWLPV